MSQPQNKSLASVIAEVAMVADVTTTALGLTRMDRKASEKANQDHVAKDGAGKVVVNRFAGADERIKKVTDLQKMALENLRTNTMAWGNSKRRLLPNTAFQKFNARHHELKADFDTSVKELVDDYDNIALLARQNTGSYDVTLPDKAEVAAAFSLELSYEPVPDETKFGRVMGDDEVTKQASEYLRWQHEQNIAAAYNGALQDTVDRMIKPLDAVVDRMMAYTKREIDLANGRNPGKDGYFRDTLVSNLQDMIGCFENANILNDPRLAKVIHDLQAFKRITPDILRDRSDIRDAVSDRAKAILKDLDGILAR